MLLIYGRVSQLDEVIDHDMADIDVDDDANTVRNNGNDCDIDFIVFDVYVYVYDRLVGNTSQGENDIDQSQSMRLPTTITRGDEQCKRIMSGALTITVEL